MKRTRILIGLLCPLATGCAMTDWDHLATTNWVDRTIVPDSRAAQWAMTPLLVPITLATLAVDNFLIAPAVNLPSAYQLTYRWETGDFADIDDGHYFAKMGVLPIRTALVPVVFAGNWTVRSFFALDLDKDAAWGWPEWGRQWERDEEGKLIGPPAPR